MDDAHKTKEELIEEIKYLKEKLSDKTKTDEHKQLLAIFDSMDEPVYVVDPQSYEILHFNNAAKKLWGYDAVGRKCYEVLHGFDSPCDFCSNDKILGGNFGETYKWECQNLLAQRCFHCINRAIQWPDGRIVRFEMAIDTTEARLFERQKEDLQSVLDEVPALIFFKDVEGRLVRVNELFVNILGLKEEDVIGKTMNEISSPEHAESFDKGDRDIILADLPRYNSIELVTTNDGDELWFQIEKVPYKDNEGKIIGVIGFGVDITQQKQFEDALYAFSNELELKVNERTKELQKKVALLERFRTATIDREFRMEELRQEIEDLKEQINAEG